MIMKKGIFILPLVILILGLILAAPSPPNVFSGSVEYSKNKSMSLTGYDISASIGTYGLGIIGKVGDNNEYEVSVDTQGRSGTITFYVGGIEAEETATYQIGEFTELDLTIKSYPVVTLCGNGIREPGEQCDNLDLGIGTCENVLGILGATGSLSCTSYCTFEYSNCVAPYCGDGVSNNGETCSSCPEDVGVCATTSSSSSSSSGGGGGGGGGSSTTKTTATTNSSNVNVSISESDNSTSGSSTETESIIKSRFTGLAISDFAKTPTGKGVIVIITVAVLLGIGLFVRRKLKK